MFIVVCQLQNSFNISLDLSLDISQQYTNRNGTKTKEDEPLPLCKLSGQLAFLFLNRLEILLDSNELELYEEIKGDVDPNAKLINFY